MICKCGCKLERTNRRNILKCNECNEIEEIYLNRIEGFNTRDIRIVYKDKYNKLYTTYTVDCPFELKLIDINTKNREGLIEYTDSEIEKIKEYMRNSIMCEHCGNRHKIEEWVYVGQEEIYNNIGVQELNYKEVIVKCPSCECTMRIRDIQKINDLIANNIEIVIEQNKYKEILVCKDCLTETTDTFMYHVEGNDIGSEDEITPNYESYRCEHCGSYDVVKVRVLKENNVVV